MFETINLRPHIPHIPHIARLAAVALLALSLGACTSIPKQNLDSYVGNFNTAKATAQDIYLSAQVQAEKLNDGTNTGNLLLAQRTRAMQARIAALDMISQYNGALVKLATGTDTEGVKTNLEGLSSNLKGFGIEQVSSLVASAAPYLGVIAQAVSLIDNAIKAQHFGEAVAAAQRPIQEIIGMLIQDADNLGEIQVQLLGKTRDPDRDKLLTLYYKLQPLADSLRADPDVAAAVGGFNASLVRWDQDLSKKPDPLVHAPAAKARAANADDRALLQTMLNQASGLVDSYNQTGAKIKATRSLTAEYKKVLDSCGTSFVELNAAVIDGRRAGTLAFAVNVMNLRKAYIEVREAR